MTDCRKTESDQENHKHCTGRAEQNFVEKIVVLGLVHQERSEGSSKAVRISNVLSALATIFKLWWKLSFLRKRLAVPPTVPPRSGLSRLQPQRSV